MRLDVNNFENHTADEYRDNLLRLGAVSGSFFDKEWWDKLGEDEGEGDYCCGKRRVEIGNTFTCLKCGCWCYSSS